MNRYGLSRIRPHEEQWGPKPEGERPVHGVAAILASGLFSCVVLLAALATCGTTLEAQAAAPRTGGAEYVRVPDWARAAGFEPRWVERDELLQVADGRHRVVLRRDSAEANVDGVQVWLLFPVRKQAESLYLSRMDIQTTLEPLLFQRRSASGSRLKTICLDPGHGGKDPGNRVGSREEKLYTLLLARELRDQLKRAGFKVLLTRTSDRYLDLPDRPREAARQKADLFLSVHFNAAENSRDSVRGSEVYCLTPAGATSTNARGEGGGGWYSGNRYNEKNILLAYHLQKSLTRGLGTEDRGVRRARWAVLRDASMPAALVEAGFMSHPSEGRRIFDPEYRRLIARCVVQGVLAYQRARSHAS